MILTAPKFRTANFELLVIRIGSMVIMTESDARHADERGPGLGVPAAEVAV